MPDGGSPRWFSPPECSESGDRLENAPRWFSPLVKFNLSLIHLPKSTSLFVHTPLPNSKLHHRNSVSILYDDFFSALSDK